MLFDNHQRIHNYLRISLTDACNLRCVYCMPDGLLQATEQKHLLQTNEIESFAKVFSKLGVTKIRLTGGEPLIRKEFDEIIQTLAPLPIQIALTTNGIQLHKHWKVLLDNNCMSVNISLDTLNESKFVSLTKRDLFKQVYQNILLLLENGFSVKVNVVVMNHINHTELIDFVSLTKDLPLHIRFIEFMPFSKNAWQVDKVFPYEQMLSDISNAFDVIKLEDDKHATTKKFKVIQHVGTFAFITTMTSPFCSTCNRLRLTADGKMKNCLFSSNETDLLTPFRNGQDIIPLIVQNIKDKKEALGGQLVADYTKIEEDKLYNRSMIQIGG
ncbi:MAG: GTP 3',8-cyclase MoaA [Chitinophagaceae bacterium]